MLSEAGTHVFLIVCPVVGLLFAAYNAWVVSKVKILKPHEMEEELRKESSGLVNSDQVKTGMQQVESISTLISDGAKSFLYAEYKYMMVFIVSFSVVILVLIGVAGTNEDKVQEFPMVPADPLPVPGDSWKNGGFSAIAFVVGCLTSILSGYIGMRIAVYTNSRTAVQAWGLWFGGVDREDRSECYTKAFTTAFQGGVVMGFSLVSFGLLNLYVTILIFRAILGDSSHEEKIRLYECIAAFGLGGSSIACFGRVGGGIFTKAADVGADLVGKVVKGLPEDSPENPGVIADCIGDNVGDIAGMGSDLFGSFGEATCAALVLGAYASPVSPTAPSVAWATQMYPLIITATGILVCFVTALCVPLGIPFSVRKKEDIEPALKYQLIISTVLATAALAPVSKFCLTDRIEVTYLRAGTHTIHYWEAYLCVITGLWCGLVIGLATEYYTSNAHRPVQELADACTTGAATNIIGGLAVGYVSAIIPVFAMAATVYVAFNLAMMYGIALAALGILSTMAIGLTIDAYGPISDNAGGIVEMSELDGDGEDHPVRDCTDNLDAAGNTTAAIGKGFAISSAAFVGMALYAAFITHAGMSSVNIVDSKVLPGLLVGAMLPCWFSAMTMKSVNTAAMAMVNEIKRQFDAGEKNHAECVRIATQGSLNEMIAPGLLVILSPIVCGILFGKECLAGLLPGSLAAGVQMAISMSNTGGAWDNAKKFIEGRQMRLDHQGNAITRDRMNRGGDEHYSPDRMESYPFVLKGHDIHKAAVVGDTVGDPLKDTSGPALNILVKLMAIISVVFVPVVTSDTIGGVLFNRAFKDFYIDASNPSKP